MNEEIEVAPVEVMKTIGPGSRLRSAREALGLHIDDVAQHLRLKPHVIGNLEKDDYESIRCDLVFLRGYLRAYAKLVDIPGDEVIEVFNKLNVQSVQSNTLEMPRSRNQVSFKDRSLRWTTYIIVLGLVVLVAVWWHNQKVDWRHSFKPASVKTESKNPAVTHNEKNSQMLRFIVGQPILPGVDELEPVVSIQEELKVKANKVREASTRN